VIDGVGRSLALHRQDPQGVGVEHLLQPLGGPDQPGQCVEDVIDGHRTPYLGLAVLEAEVSARDGYHEALVQPCRGLPQGRSIGDRDLGGGGQGPHLSVPPALRPLGRDLRLAVGQLKEARLVGIHADRLYARQPTGPMSGEHGRAGAIVRLSAANRPPVSDYRQGP